MKASRIIPATWLLGIWLSSCSLIHEDIPPCKVTYRVNFKYTANILNADAFPSQVTDLNLAVYDETGCLTVLVSDHRELSELNTYHMPLDLPPGSYTLIAWCEGVAHHDAPVSFQLQGQSQGNLITESGASLEISSADDENSMCHSYDIRPLFYGKAEGIIITGEENGDIDIATIPLIKDTNRLSVVLQHLNGTSMDPEEFEFTLHGENCTLDWENNVKEDNPQFHYHPWETQPLYMLSPGTRDEVSPGVRTEFTTGRLMADMEQRLTVTSKQTGREVLSIPLIEYLLLVRGNYTVATSSQDYLDRFDDYSLVFFLDDNNRWIESSVIINGWRIVPPQDEEIL